MHPEVMNFAQISVIIVGLLGSLATIAVLTFRSIAKAQSRAAVGAPQNDQRLEQLQQSVDAIAVEVERIAEAQRFSAKLLSERAETSSLPR